MAGQGFIPEDAPKTRQEAKPKPREAEPVRRATGPNVPDPDARARRHRLPASPPSAPQDESGRVDAESALRPGAQSTPKSSFNQREAGGGLGPSAPGEPEE